MELSETHTLPVPQQRAWDALNDTEILRACIPGCESIDPDGENAYAVTERRPGGVQGAVTCPGLRPASAPALGSPTRRP